MKYDLEHFNSGEELKKARDNSGLTQGQFATKLGIDKKKVQNCEDRGMTNIKTYMEWCNKLGCDIDFLLGVQEMPTRDEADIYKKTGLLDATVKSLSEELNREPYGVNCGIKTVDILNDMSGQSIKGRGLKDSMIQYATEAVVFRMLSESIANIVDHHNEQAGSSDSVQLMIRLADSTLTSLRRITSLSSLTMAGRMQTGIDSDLDNFIEAMKKNGFNKTDSKVFYDYLQSKSRCEALKLGCYNLLLEYLEELAQDRELTYLDMSKAKLGELDASATILYNGIGASDSSTQPEKPIRNARANHRLLAELDRCKRARNQLVETNNRLSAELNDERQKAKELQKVIYSIPDGDMSLTELNKENAELKETVSVLYEANQGLDEKVKELERELEKLRKPETNK